MLKSENEENLFNLIGFAGIAGLLQEDSKNQENKFNVEGSDDCLEPEFATEPERNPLDTHSESLVPIGFAGISDLLDNQFGVDESISTPIDRIDDSENENATVETNSDSEPIEKEDEPNRLDNNSENRENKETREENDTNTELVNTSKSQNSKVEQRESTEPIGFAGLTHLVRIAENHLTLSSRTRKAVQKPLSEHVSEKFKLEKTESGIETFLKCVGIFCIFFVFIGVIGMCTSDYETKQAYVSPTPTSQNYSSNRTGETFRETSSYQSTNSLGYQPGRTDVESYLPAVKLEERERENISQRSEYKETREAKSNKTVPKSVKASEKHSVGKNLILTPRQIHYCLAEEVKIRVARSELNVKLEEYAKKIEIIGLFEKAEKKQLKMYRGWRGEYKFYESKLNLFYVSWISSFGGLQGDKLYRRLKYTKLNFKNECRKKFRSVACRNLREDFEAVISVYKQEQLWRKLYNRIKFDSVDSDYKKRCSR